ncbi:MAG TPA: serine/threonine-protein kinase, partial [Candidatus Polarisedimenticolia bacterium]|nr:serine/threonine-protein kinase [Candidatus Polarisedimenticolia bacterium]
MNESMPDAADRWKLISAILDQALEFPAGERSRFLDKECAQDPDLKREILALLATSEKSPGLLEASFEGWAGTLLREIAGEDSDAETMGIAVGPYRTLGEVGRGGMGVVLLAERADGQFQHRVALKLIKKGLDSEEILSRFLRERQILARLQHPHIARLLDGGLSADGRPYFAMEYVEGEPLTSFCDRRGMGIEQRLGLFLDACSAVQHAHRSLVVHRDLKPSNILVTTEGEVKLLDFGIARLLSAEGGGDATLTQPGPRPMTPEYAAPEQVRGEPATTATDVYALGLVLYELLVGRRPYRLAGLTPPEVEKTILETRPEAPSTLASGSPAENGDQEAEPGAIALRRGTTPEKLRRILRGDLDTIVLTALSKEPARRYSSVEALADDLRRHLSRQPIRARPAGRMYRLKKFASRHRVGFAASALILTLLVAFAITMTIMAGRQLRERRRAEIAGNREKRVRDFLSGMLKAAGPPRLGSDLSVTGTPPQDVTVRQVLEQAARDLGNDLAGQPEVEAAVRAVIGETYFALHLNDAAESQLLASLVIQEKHPENREELSETFVVLGRVLEDQGRLDEAKARLEQALKIMEEGPRKESVATCNVLTDLARIHVAKGDLAGARELIVRALALGQRVERADSPNLLPVLEGHASIMTKLGNKEEAMASQREGVRISRKALGEDHPDTITAVHNLAIGLGNFGKFD